MIVHLRQEKTNFDISYRFTQGDQTLCVAQAPFQMGRFDMSIQYAGGPDWQLHFNASEGKTMRERLSFKLFQEGTQVGTLVGATKKTGRLFGGYPYYEISYFGQEYQLYQVGFGSIGLYLCLYQGDRLLAIAEKDLEVINYQDTYTLYLDSPEQFHLMTVALLYYDVISYDDFMKISVHSRKKDCVVTPQRELQQKYDPTFIPRIRERDGNL